MIGLNYIYLSEKHAGGKDQVGLNLLKGFHENGVEREFEIICWDYSEKLLKAIAPEAKYRILKSHKGGGEFKRLLNIVHVNTVLLPKIIREDDLEVIYHLSCNNGLRKLPTKVVSIPHDIKAVSHRVLGTVKVPLYKYLIYKIMYEMDFRHADVIIGISDYDRDDIKKHYPKYSDKVCRVYDPIITDDLRLERTGEKRYICAMNLQFHHKNTITLIKAYELIRNQIDYKLVLIGNVPDRVAYLKEYVEKNGLTDDVVFTGFASDQKVNELLGQCALYVNPSLYEGFGMTAVEAIIKKVPTLLSGIPVHREVTMGLATYYDDLQNPRALADAIMGCLANVPTESELESASNTLINAYDYVNISKKYYDMFVDMRRQAK